MSMLTMLTSQSARSYVIHLHLALSFDVQPMSFDVQPNNMDHACVIPFDNRTAVATQECLAVALICP